MCVRVCRAGAHMCCCPCHGHGKIFLWYVPEFPNLQIGMSNTTTATATAIPVAANAIVHEYHPYLHDHSNGDISHMQIEYK